MQRPPPAATANAEVAILTGLFNFSIHVNAESLALVLLANYFGA